MFPRQGDEFLLIPLLYGLIIDGLIPEPYGVKDNTLQTAFQDLVGGDGVL